MTTSFEFERDRAYNRLVSLIFGGTLEAGAPLSERKLAEQLDIGRMPVREALRQLEQEGVVEVKPARGTFVRRVSAEDLSEIYRVREVLECLAADLAATNGASPSLLMCGTRMRTMAQDPSAFTAVEIDDTGTEFHELLMQAAGNMALSETVRLLRLRFRLAFHLPRYFSHENVYSTLTDHIAILDAIVAREPRLAAKLMRAHLRRGLEMRQRLEITTKPLPGRKTTPQAKPPEVKETT
ncbi:GntR family transcriptional regulator [Ancylobacter pratisalsi]|uniref:GntR family transcriptional regulator n=1 Tax=Ancylobacter pratisalsi TaxID=1745854 RepID=A0A6P1YK80_9HYPH|nr:GntR family transcriptional regulator [Ancylobacter pratisalsi]QIB33525.1 GntR family transcriptional regulator [Ancylobacter pratisalsi]